MSDFEEGRRGASLGWMALLVVACGGRLGGDDASTTADSGSDTAVGVVDGDGDGSDACTSASLHVDVLNTAALPAITIKTNVGVAFTDPSILADPGPATYLTCTAIDADGGHWLEAATAPDGGTQFFGNATDGSEQFPCDAGSCTLALGPAVTVNDPGAPIYASVKTFTQMYLVDPSASPKEQLERGFIAKSDDYGFQLGGYSPWIRWNDDPVAQGTTIDRRTFPELAACKSFGEPTAAARPKSMDLALTCRTASGTRIVLLRSVNHAQSFTFVSTLLDETDAAALGGTTADVLSPELFDVGGKSYLVVSTASAVDASLPISDACVTVELASYDVVARDCANHPIVTRRMIDSQHRQFGSCTYGQDGYFASVYDPSATPASRIVATGITTP